MPVKSAHHTPTNYESTSENINKCTKNNINRKLDLRIKMTNLKREEIFQEKEITFLLISIRID